MWVTAFSEPAIRKPRENHFLAYYPDGRQAVEFNQIAIQGVLDARSNRKTDRAFQARPMNVAIALVVCYLTV